MHPEKEDRLACKGQEEMSEVELMIHVEIYIFSICCYSVLKDKYLVSNKISTYDDGDSILTLIDLNS